MSLLLNQMSSKLPLFLRSDVSGLTFGMRGMPDQTKIYLEIFKVCKMKERLHACKLPVVWHCFSISWTSWKQILMKPDEAPSGVSCKLFMNTDSAVLYSAELHSYKIMEIKQKVIIWVVLQLCMCSGYGTIMWWQNNPCLLFVWKKLSRIWTHTQSPVWWQVIGTLAFRVWWVNRNLFCMKAQIAGLIDKYSSYLCVKSKLKANIKSLAHGLTVERVC